MGWLGTTLLVVGIVAALAGCGMAYALSRNGAAVLDAGDRLLQGDGAIRLVATANYGTDPQQKLEMFVPARTTGPATGLLPVVVFIHGGGWDSGDPHDYRFVARTLAPHGYAVVLAGYRLYPKVRYPAMLEDSAAAVAWVAAHAAQYGGDPARIVLMGHSAGAYNAVAITLERQWLGRAGLDADALRGTIGLAGPYDFYPFDKPSAIHSFGEASDPRATQPINHVRADAPPLLLLSGDADTTVKKRNSIALARALTEAGAPTEAHLLAGVTHEKIVMMLAQPFARDRRVIDAVLPFLARVTAPVTAPVTPASAPVQPPGG
ncbi:alpha/beta hydrolase [Novosphingobium lentum]|uniref:alpha/beta hydrolase n=1 Tax=Novosphingobium lentum TaxID=145287 RepID=UPI0009FE464A|nr:alpha/beta hydrolase [Novosphingobium lentum]